MKLKDKISKEMVSAMKAKEKVKLEALRSVKSALLLEETNGGNKEISSETEIKLLQRLVKQRIESGAIYKEQGRPELAQLEEDQAKIIEKFLPAQLSADEVLKIVEQLIKETGATSIKDMGKVMGLAVKKTEGKTDNKTLSTMIREKLS